MSEKEFDLSHYLEKIKNHKKEELFNYVSNNGTVNDVDYYVEVMKKEYPDYDYSKLYVQFRNYKPKGL